MGVRVLTPFGKHLHVLELFPVGGISRMNVR